MAFFTPTIATLKTVITALGAGVDGDKQISEKLKNMDKKDCDKLCKAMILIENILRKYDKK